MKHVRNFAPLMRCALVLMFISLASLPVKADMLISPVRLLLQQSGETANFVLRNPSDGPRTYRLEWIEQAQTRDGVGERYEDGASIPHPQAAPYLRFTPRQITVEPRSNQTVRVNFRPDEGLPPGEYRSHLLFRVVPEVSEPVSRSTIGAGGEGIQLTLDMQLSIAVPVVIRYRLDEMPTVKISQVTPVIANRPDQQTQLGVLLKHDGRSSSFGRVTVDMQTSATGEVKRIGMLENISVFPDVGERHLTLSLSEKQFPPGALIRVTYEGADEYRGRIWDEQVLQVR